MMFRAILIVFLSALSLTSQAQLANLPPVPHWLRVDSEKAVIEKSFDQKEPLLKAILLIAAETETTLFINERQVAQVMTPKGDSATSLDVTAFIRAGTNRLRLQASRPRVAALLELNGDLARKQWIATDETWTSSAELTQDGAVDQDPTQNPFDLKKTFDAYNSWQLAKRERQNQATDPTAFTLPEGFQVELIRSAQPEDDSWVAMAFDSQGRITLAREKRGLLRFNTTNQSLELINDTLLECRGLLYAHAALFAHANNSKGLFRLKDTNGDDLFDEVKELVHTEGGVGHGRNHLKLGPDGHLWIACGNNVLLPSPLAENSPLKNYAWDQLLPNPWDGSMFDGTVELPAGYIMRMKPDGTDIQIIAGGLRNPLDIAFNRQGELFTFDADMERDVGTPWYMSNRVLHVIPGADFGWRRGTGRFPAWYVDTLPSVVDVGLASPTAVFFGHGAKFPRKYQEALFICDWSYGRILAVNMKEKGSSYTGEFETFMTGRPLNITDGCIGPDGALWFITGGRGTQSGLYRVTSKTSDPPTDERHPIKGTPIGLRRLLNTLYMPPSSGFFEANDATQKLDDLLGLISEDDRHLNYTLRLSLESFPKDILMTRALAEKGKRASFLLWHALIRLDEAQTFKAIIACLSWLKSNELSPEEKQDFLRLISLGLIRLGEKADQYREPLLAALEPLYPATSGEVNQELCRLLIALKSPQVIKKTLPLLRKATSSEDLLFYPLHLRYLQEGWTQASRQVMFEALNRAEKLNGASTYFKAIQDTRSEMAAALSAKDATALAAVIHPAKPVALSAHAMPGHTYRVWKLEDLEGTLDQVGSQNRSFEKGRAAAISTQCVFCHRMSPDVTLPAGAFGPDLVQVSARFSRRDLLDHILNPSKVVDEKFRYFTIIRHDGSQVIGSLESEDDERVVLKPNPLSQETVEIGKSLIRDRHFSETSPMPAGLMNSLRLEQILDLLAFIEAGGEKKKP